MKFRGSFIRNGARFEENCRKMATFQIFFSQNCYNIVKKFADLKGNETVYDLYCGIGTISLFLANVKATK